jgi:hypothetical protein
MYSIIIPTMWKCNRFQQTLRELSAHELVGEIILIDNTSNELTIELPKLIHILEGKNTFVNPAWNKGVEMTKYNKLLILNDDIWMDWNILNIVESYITEDNGVIGMAEENYHNPSTELGLEPITHRNGGFGCAMFIHRENYTPIPTEMKIWCGDDWLFVKNRNRRKQNYKITGFKIEGEISATTDTLSNIDEIKERDLVLKDYYKLF